MAYRDTIVCDDRSRGIFRVHRSAMTSERILADERSHIFNKCWLYVGHASEVAKPGDYLRRWVGGKPVIFLRDSGGTVRIHYNTCTHRGATLCREASGNTRVFQCFYHAWTFDTTGRLMVTPGAEAYTAGFDKADYALRGPARVAEYRGLYFLNHDPDAMDLRTYLAGATEYLDLILDQGGDEGMRIVDGAHLYSVRTNWKLMVENSIDGYHAPTVHATYVDFVKDSGGGTNPAALGTGQGFDLGNGHATMESVAAWAKPTYWEPFYGDAARPEVEAKRARLIDRYGAERGERIAGNFRNLLIFPNLIINDVAAITVRRIEPVAPDRVSVEAWALAPVDEPDGSVALQRRLDSFLTFLGPGGFASPDDVEALESCQQGFAAQPGVEWSDISRGMGRVPLPNDELQIRTFWRAWASQMDGAGFPEQIVDVETPQVSQPAARS